MNVPTWVVWDRVGMGCGLWVYVWVSGFGLGTLGVAMGFGMGLDDGVVWQAGMCGEGGEWRAADRCKSRRV